MESFLIFFSFQKADLAVADLTITYEREQGVDFTMPFMNLGNYKLFFLLTLMYTINAQKIFFLYTLIGHQFPYRCDDSVYEANGEGSQFVLLFVAIVPWGMDLYANSIFGDVIPTLLPSFVSNNSSFAFIKLNCC